MFKQKDAVYAIHSNYFDQSVVQEQLLASKAFYSPYYYIAKITDNKSMMLKWLLDEELYIVGK